MDGSHLQRAQDLASHLSVVTAVMILEGAGFPSCLPLTGMKWLSQSCSKWISSIYLCPTQGFLPLLALSPGNSGWYNPVHPRARQKVKVTQFCAVRVVLVDLVALDRQNNTRETQLPGDPSAVPRRVANHCLLGKRATLPSGVWGRDGGVCVSSVGLHGSKDLCHCYCRWSSVSLPLSLNGS